MDEKIITRINRKLYLDTDRNDEWAQYDAIDGMEWEIPWKAEEWVRKKVSPAGHDGLKTAVNMFNTYLPKWEILPRGQADKEKAEELERWLEWQMWKANQMGEQEPFRTALKYSAKYTLIAAQLDYLPYWLTENTEERRKLLQTGSFCIQVHNPAAVHYEMGKYGLRWVALVDNIPAADCLDHWEQYEDGADDESKLIKGALVKVREALDADDEARLVYIDYTDKDKRYVAFYVASDDALPDTLDIGEGNDLVEIVNAENKLPFINWVIGKASGDPLFYSIYKSGAWENQNFLESIADSIVIRRAFFPLIQHTSSTNKPLEVDFSGVEPVVELGPGESATTMSPPPLDPGVRELMDRNTQSLGDGLGVRGLQSSAVAGNVQFATVNAQVQLSKAVLDPHIRNFERCAAALGRMAFQWVQYMKTDSVTAYRTKSKGNGKEAGMKINVSPKDFDPDTLMIVCELLANAPTDDMQRWNMYSGMMQTGLPIPRSEIVERLEMGNPDVLADKYWEEKTLEFAFQLMQQKKQAELQLQIQQKQQQMQMEAQQQQQQQMAQATAPQAQGMVPPQQGPGTPPAFDPTQGQGFNPAMMGSSPMEAAPQMTQTATRQA